MIHAGLWLHVQIAEALENSYESGADVKLADIAYHFVRGLRWSILRKDSNIVSVRQRRQSAYSAWTEARTSIPDGIELFGISHTTRKLSDTATVGIS